MSARTLGVEEEFLLVDLARAGLLEGGDAAAGRQGLEPVLERVGTATPVLRALAELGPALTGLRRAAGDGARRRGAALLAAGTSPLPLRHQVPDPRTASAPGGTARERATLGCHVHVAVASPDEAAGAIDRMRPWLPPLVAMAANSPFWRGADTGYASYRTQVRGVQLFPAPSGAGPAVRVEVADVALDVAGAVLVAALVRALVDTAAREWRHGRPAPSVRPELVRLATWRASRSGLAGVLVDVATRQAVPARVLVNRLVRHVRDSLDDAGDLPVVEELVAALLRGGTGAARQRDAYRAAGRLEDVVRMIAAHTAPDLAPSLAG